MVFHQSKTNSTKARIRRANSALHPLTIPQAPLKNHFKGAYQLFSLAKYKDIKSILRPCLFEKRQPQKLFGIELPYPSILEGIPRRVAGTNGCLFNAKRVWDREFVNSLILGRKKRLPAITVDKCRTS